MTTLTKPRFCAAPGCNLPAWDGYDYCPHCILAYDQIAEAAASEAYTITVITLDEAQDKVAQGTHEFVSTPFQKDGLTLVGVALID